jgi:hypothetical protein
MAFNFAALPLQSLGLLAGLVFLASLIGHSLSGSSKFLGAIFTVIIFAAAYVFWNYYDHGVMTAIRQACLGLPEARECYGAAPARGRVRAVVCLAGHRRVDYFSCRCAAELDGDQPAISPLR